MGWSGCDPIHLFSVGRVILDTLLFYSRLICAHNAPPPASDKPEVSEIFAVRVLGVTLSDAVTLIDG